MLFSTLLLHVGAAALGNSGNGNGEKEEEEEEEGEEEEQEEEEEEEEEEDDADVDMERGSEEDSCDGGGCEHGASSTKRVVVYAKAVLPTLRPGGLLHCVNACDDCARVCVHT